MRDQIHTVEWPTQENGTFNGRAEQIAVCKFGLIAFKPTLIIADKLNKFVFAIKELP